MSPGIGFPSTGVHAARWSLIDSIWSRTFSLVTTTLALGLAEAEVRASSSVGRTSKWSLESEGLALLEFQVVDVGLGRDFDVLLLDDFLIGVANDRFEGFLTDGLSELLANHCGGCLSRAESGKADGRCVAARRLFLSVLYSFNGNGDLDVPVDPVPSCFVISMGMSQI